MLIKLSTWINLETRTQDEDIVNFDSISFERREEFENLGRNLKTQNNIQEEIESRLN